MASPTVHPTPSEGLEQEFILNYKKDPKVHSLGSFINAKIDNSSYNLWTKFRLGGLYFGSRDL